MNNLRVCLVCDDFLPNRDGVIGVVINYHKYFLKHAKSLLVVPRVGKTKPTNIKNIHYVPSTKNIKSYVTPYPYSDRTLKKDLEKFKPNIIHIHSPFILGKYFMRYAKKHNIPCLLTFHTKYYLDFKRILKSTILSKIAMKSVVNLSNKVDYLFTVSHNMIKEMHSYGIKKYPINVLENGSDLPVFKKHSCDDEINSKFKIPSNSFVILLVSRIIKYKNLALIINGAKALSKRVANFKFLICGDGNDLA
jgi:glycosyltransferase involved in cell wall biosynthesis